MTSEPAAGPDAGPALSPAVNGDVGDALVFRPDTARPARLMSWGAVQRSVDELAGTIRASLGRPRTVIGIFQGGWLVAQCLADHFPDAELLAVAGDVRGGRLRPALLDLSDGLMRPAAPPAQGEVLLVDEVVDSGRTARFHLDHLRENFGVEARLVCLAASAEADPRPEFAARTMEALPLLVLPWRLLRDFEQTASCLLRTEPLTTRQIDDRLRECGHAIATGVLEAHLGGLRERGFLTLDGQCRWHLSAC